MIRAGLRAPPLYLPGPSRCQGYVRPWTRSPAVPRRDAGGRAGSSMRRSTVAAVGDRASIAVCGHDGECVLAFSPCRAGPRTRRCLQTTRCSPRRSRAGAKSPRLSGPAERDLASPTRQMPRSQCLRAVRRTPILPRHRVPALFGTPDSVRHRVRPFRWRPRRLRHRVSGR